MFERLVVGVDGSDHSYRAVKYACDMASLAGSRLLLVCVYRPIRMPDSSHSMVRPQLHPEPADTGLHTMAQEVVEAAARFAKQQGADPEKVETYIRHGPTARTLAGFAAQHDAQAILVGGRGLGDISAFMLGSVSHKLATLSECTVILVK